MAFNTSEFDLCYRMVEQNSKRENYTVVARRYRPTTFEQLIGQDQVATALTNAIKQDRIGHAYLFTGARGVGKTSTARIFAKCLNCQNGGPTITPCSDPQGSDHCDICRSIESGEDVDVIEIDGASNNGVDNIRELRANANIRPSRSKFKVYIIDEVHMLSKGAFNALLKTLEEPPSHVKFVFCTTEPEKIPITVRSRCQQFDFLPVQSKEIKQRLQEIAENENVTADDQALTLLAQRAKGSMRDSQSLLEQLLSFTAGTITAADVHQLLGTADTGHLFEIATSLVESNSADAMKLIAQAIDAGVDAGQLTEQLLGLFRDVLACKVGCDSEIFLQAGPDDQSKLQSIADQRGIDQLLSLLQILDKTLVSMRMTTHGRTLLEMAAVRICYLDNLTGISTLISSIRSGEVDTSKLTAAISTPSAVGAIDDSKKNAEPITGPSQPLPAIAETRDPSPSAGSSGHETAADKTSESTEINAGNIAKYWTRTLGEISDSTSVMAGDFQQLAMIGENQLVVTLTDSYNKEACNRPEKKSRFEKVLSDLTGRTFRVDFQVQQAKPEAATEAQPVLTRRKVIRQLHQHPMLNKALEIFDAEITDFKQIKPK